MLYRLSLIRSFASEDIKQNDRIEYRVLSFPPFLPSFLASFLRSFVPSFVPVNVKVLLIVYFHCFTVSTQVSLKRHLRDQRDHADPDGLVEQATFRAFEVAVLYLFLYLFPEL